MVKRGARNDLAALLLAIGLVLGPGALLASALHVPPSLHPDGVTVIESEASYSFAQQVTFRLKAASDADITQVYLFFHAAGDEETETLSVPLETTAREVSVEQVHDLRRFPLPPFATITFWWQIEDAAGEELWTEPQTFEYADNRFRWSDLDGDGISIHWIEGQGDPAFGQTALDVARASVREINAELRAPVPDPIDIYIYDKQQNLSAAMMLTGRDWIGGQARPELGVIVVAVPFADGYASQMKRYLPHEITHLLLYERVTPSGYRHVPEWLDEGLATVNERLPTPEYALTLEEAREGGRLLPLEELCVPFSPDPRTAVLAYAQSASVVQFIQERYGADGIRALLTAYADGASCTSGVEEALDASFNKLETDWRTSLEPQAPWRAWMDQIGVWVGLWLLSLLVAVPMIGGFGRR